MSHHFLLTGLLLVLSPLATGCDSSVVGGGDGAGGDMGEGGADGEGGQEAAASPAPPGGVDVPLTCTGPVLEGCLYDVVVCVEEDGMAVWACGDTPLVLAFDREPVDFHHGAEAAFDLSGLGQSIGSDWPTAATPWLALDRDGDGAIGDGTELFGSAVALAGGDRARNGFEALAELDADGNGVIDARDPGFAELAVWADADADRLTDRGELRSATEGARRLVSIDLAYVSAPRCDARGNCGIERAPFVWADASGAHHQGEVVDVHLPRRQR